MEKDRREIDRPGNWLNGKWYNDGMTEWWHDKMTNDGMMEWLNDKMTERWTSRTMELWIYGKFEWWTDEMIRIEWNDGWMDWKNEWMMECLN